MSDIVTPAIRALPGLTGPTPLLTGVIADPPRNLIGVAPGTILKGTVLGRGPDGLTSVATDRGVVKVATAAQLPAGSNVTLEVRNAGDRLQVLILSVDTASGRQSAIATPPPTSGGTAASGAAAGPAPPPPSSDAAVEPTTRPPPPIEFVNNSLRAIVVHMPPDSALLPTPDVDIAAFTAPPEPISVPADAVQKAQLLAQARLLVQTPADILLAAQTETATAATVPAGAPPAAIGTPAAAATIPGALPPSAAAQVLLPPEIAQRIAALFAEAAVETKPAGASPLQLGHLSVGGPLATGQAPLVAKIATGAEVTLNIIAVLATKGGEIEIAPEAVKLGGGAVPLLGTVLGFTRAGHPVIDTPAGTIMLQQKARLPVGAQVALILDPVAPMPAATVLPITSPQQALFQLSSAWPSLDDVIAILRGAGTGANDATPPPPPGVPQTGPKLAAGLANAIAALRSGEVEKLLGPLLAGRKLPADKEDAVKRLRDEFAQLSSLAQDRPNVDWRALFLPLYDERMGLTQINLYYRRGGGNSEDPDSKENGTRFLVEVNFAVLGAFQLDGLVRGKRFDLMIRSRRARPPSERRALISIFEDALALSGNSGGLEFRTVDRFPVSPLEELRQSHAQITA
ncbi:MAG: hypothetical protein ABUL54_04975 [Dongia sp.]